MWKRFRRRSFAPRRPAVFADEWPLLAVTLLVLAGGGYLVWQALAA
jgi:hypothetical protein